MSDDAVERDRYARFARYYDLEYASVDADLDFYRSFAIQANGPVLELGCGTGRVLAALEDLQLALTGVDSSPAMLDIARKSLHATTTLVESDIIDLATCAELPDKPYWMAFSAINSFLHFPDTESQIAALEAVRAVMVTGGILLLDLMVPEPSYLAALDGRLLLEFSTTLPDGQRLDKLVSRTHELASQTIQTAVLFDTIDALTGTVTRVADGYDTRYIHRFELEYLLERAGWRLVSVYGSYDLEPYGSESERMIALATWGDMHAGSATTGNEGNDGGG
jgi:SAM-dependent methyltransferase